MIEVPKRILFVCSANYIRSPTAEYVARKRGLLASSCGTARFPDFVVISISAQLVEWADVLVCMESEHTRRVMQYPAAKLKRVYCWNLPDDYDCAYEEPLVNIVTCKLEDTLRLEEKAGHPHRLKPR